MRWREGRPRQKSAGQGQGRNAAAMKFAASRLLLRELERLPASLLVDPWSRPDKWHKQHGRGMRVSASGRSVADSLLSTVDLRSSSLERRADTGTRPHYGGQSIFAMGCYARPMDQAI